MSDRPDPSRHRSPWRPSPEVPPGWPPPPVPPPLPSIPQPPLPMPERPSIPFMPFPPERTEVPADVWDRLLARRIVLVGGYLDEPAATRVAAQVMLLDADADDPIQLHIGCPDGDLDASVMLAETVDLLRVPVHAVAGGILGGSVLAVYASAQRRLAHRHAGFQLREPRAQMEGNAEQLAGRIAQHQHQLDYLHEHVAEACGQSVDAVAEDMRTGRLLTARAAVDYGLVHELVGRGALSTPRTEPPPAEPPSG